MKIIEKKIEPTEVEHVTDIICNLCGESCMAPDKMNTTECPVQAEGCFSSVFPPDLEMWKFDLCEYCLAFLVSRFKIYPTSFEMRNAHFALCGVPEPHSEEEFCPTKNLLMHGKTLDVDTTIGETTWFATPDHVRAAYAKAMSRAILFSSDEDVRRAGEAAAQAAEAIERQRKESLDARHAIHGALDEIACPGSGTVLERVRLLKNEPLNERLVRMIGDLFELLDKRFSSGEVSREREAEVLGCAQGFLEEIRRVDKR